MNRSLFGNLSANFFQLMVNQITGFIIFYILANGLDKITFGHINLALALLMAAFNILSFGMDQILVKKIAAGAHIPSVLSIYICHVLLTGLLFYAILVSGSVFVDQTGKLYSLILLIGAGKLMIFFSTPFKQAANGMERFRLLAGMCVMSNSIRCITLIVLSVTHHITLYSIVVVFIAGDTAECVLSFFLFSKATRIPLKVSQNFSGYKQLLIESLPQAGVVVITSALARFDWLVIGFVISAMKLAEYSFAYKIFEISTLPLLAVAPLLIPRFTKLFQLKTNDFDFKFFARIEMVVSVFIALLLNICWPFIDVITGGRYGLVNVKTIFILSLCMPFLYLNNLLWTSFFAQGKLKTILSSFVLTFFVNVAGNILLVPFLENEGAAFAFLAACVAQSIYYITKNELPGLSGAFYPLIICGMIGLFSGIVTKMLFESWLALPASFALYASLLFIFSQIKPGDQKSLKQLLSV